MKGLFGFLGLLMALAVLALVLKQSLGSRSDSVKTQPPAEASSAGVVPPEGTVREQAQQMQQQYKRAIEGVLQKPRALPDDE